MSFKSNPPTYRPISQVLDGTLEKGRISDGNCGRRKCVVFKWTISQIREIACAAAVVVIYEGVTASTTGTIATTTTATATMMQWYSQNGTHFRWWDWHCHWTSLVNSCNKKEREKNKQENKIIYQYQSSKQCALN